MKNICDNCIYNEGKEEYEENKIGLFCSHPKINDYVDIVVRCRRKRKKK